MEICAQIVKLSFSETVTATAAMRHKINLLKKMLEDNPNQSDEHVTFTLQEIKRLTIIMVV